MPKQVIVQSSIEAVEIIDTPTPVPKDNEIVIKVVVSGSNPKDWKHPHWKGFPHNSGDDLAGTVHAVGKDVFEFKPGDRVSALHEFTTDYGSFGEYAVARDATTFHLPDHVSFEEGATIPLAALTAALALYFDMGISAPYDLKPGENGGGKDPILIYGVTSAVGAFAAKLARLSGLRPIIGIAGRAGEFAKTLVDHVVDYRVGEDALVASVERILIEEGLHNRVPKIFDAISENGSLEATLRLIEPNDGVISTVLPPKFFAKDKDNFEYPSGVRAMNTLLPLVFTIHQDFAYIWSRFLSRLLADRRLKGHPFEVVPGGLGGVLAGLQKLKNGEASGVKYVFRIEEETKDMMSGMLGVDGQPTVDQPPQSPHPMSFFPLPGPPEK